MKVLMAPSNIAQQPIMLTKELRERGIEATCIQYITAKKLNTSSHLSRTNSCKLSPKTGCVTSLKQ